jgi:hypothetical protein
MGNLATKASRWPVGTSAEDGPVESGKVQERCRASGLIVVRRHRAAPIIDRALVTAVRTAPEKDSGS